MDGLHELSVGSFSRVCRPVEESVVRRKGKTSDRPALSTIERAAKEGENVRLVLRSAGAPFPPPEPSGDDPQPPFVVGLAHHRPSDAFLLFAFTPQTLPCRMARFDRDGKDVRRGKIGGGYNPRFDPKSFLWGKKDAAVLLAAVDKCGSGYFERGANTEEAIKAPESMNGDVSDGSDSDGSDSEQDEEHESEYMRLVQGGVEIESLDHQDDKSKKNGQGGEEDRETKRAAEEEARAIRAIILNELLGSGDSGNHHHPDKNFMLPLCLSISKELERWRHLCHDLLEEEDWPELPSPDSSDDKSSDKKDEEMTPTEQGDFDEITSKRKSQFGSLIELCKGALGRMESLLQPLITSVSSTDGPAGPATTSFVPAYQLGKECVSSVEAVRAAILEHPDNWCDYHDGIDDIWREHGDEFTADEHDDGKAVDLEHKPQSYYEAAYSLVESWVIENRAVLKNLSHVVSGIDKSLGTGDQEALHKAHDCVRSTQDELQRMTEASKRSTTILATAYVKLWHAPTSSDDEGDDEVTTWVREGAYPRWTKDDIDAHLSFGWRVSEREVPSPMNFIIDHATLRASFRNCLGCLSPYDSSSRYRDDFDYNLTYYEEQERKFDSLWEKSVAPMIDAALATSEQLFSVGDLRNGSLLIATFCSVLCDSTALGKIVDDFDWECSSLIERRVTKKILQAMRKFDILMIQSSLAYFDIEQPRIAAGAHWLLDVLSSGALYFPTKESEIEWRDAKKDGYGRARVPQWQNHSHPADGVFLNGGWHHPALRAILEGRETETEWSNLEAPVVVKERFNLMRQQGNKQGAIGLARVANGDHDCMAYLLQNGMANEAIMQASTSRNTEGLARLSRDLLQNDGSLCAGVLCMQAFILGVIDGLDPDTRPGKGIETFAEIFRAKWLVSEATERVEIPQRTTNVPSLHLQSSVTFVEKLLSAARTTGELQSLLESRAFATSGFSLPAVAVAVVALALPPRTLLKEMASTLSGFLQKAGLFVVNEKRDNVKYSGLLTRFDRVPTSLGGKNFLDICCALYAISIFFMEKECKSVFCYDVALFSSVHIAVHTGCQSFALNLIHSVKNLDEERFEDHSCVSPMNSLSACYSSLFVSKCARRCPQVSESLLETFLNLEIERSPKRYSDYIVNSDVDRARLWMAIAFMQCQGAETAASALVDNIMLSRPVDDESRRFSDNDKDLERSIRGVLKGLSSLDGENENSGNDKHHTMSPFARSSTLKEVTELERNGLALSFVEGIFKRVESLSSPLIAECVRLHRAIDPSFYAHGADAVHQRLEHPNGFALTLANKASLLHTCQTMYYMDWAMREGEDWCTHFAVLECGILWLQNALSTPEMLSFDNAEDRQFRQYEGDHTTLFRERHWTYTDTNERYLCRLFHQTPKFAASALTALVKATVAAVEEPQLDNVCKQALAFCSCLDYLLRPTQTRLDAVVATQDAMGLAIEDFPSHLRPESLVTFVLSVRWDDEPDLAGPTEKHKKKRKEDESISIPFLIPRIEAALQYNKAKEASDLIMRGNTDIFWSRLSDKESCSYAATAAVARESLQGCLIVLKELVTTKREVLSEEFVNHALYLAMSINWFQACDHESHANDRSMKLVASHENVAILHETALLWNELVDVSESPFSSSSLNHCLNGLALVSRCLSGMNEKDRVCTSCRRGTYYHSKDDDHGDPSNEANLSAREERAKLRKKRKFQGGGDVVSDLHELELYLTQLHMKDASDWVKAALERAKPRPKLDSMSMGCRKQARTARKL